MLHKHVVYCNVQTMAIKWQALKFPLDAKYMCPDETAMNSPSETAHTEMKADEHRPNALIAATNPFFGISNSEWMELFF